MSRPEAVDEGLIHAWLDGELTGEEAARVERLVATDAAWSAAVAEARGFIAASSRIVGALDAVPAHVIPAGSKAAPLPALRVRPWMRIAAGVVFLAGTAYTVREVSVRLSPEPPAAAVETVSLRAAPPPPVANTADARREDRRVEQPAAEQSTQALGPEIAPADLPAKAQAYAPSAAPVVASPPPPAPTVGEVAALEAQKAESDRFVARTAERTAERTADRSAAPRAARSQLSTPSRDAVLGAAGAAASAPSAPSLGALEGCWRATAPDSLVGLYRDPTILREVGDTLVLILPNAMTVTVVRRDDSLRGALTATRVSCPPESSRSPRDSR